MTRAGRLYLKGGSHIGPNDGLLIFSVSGGDKAKNVSVNLMRATVPPSRKEGIYGIVGRSGGYTKQQPTYCAVIPPLYPDRRPPQIEGLAAVIWHLLVMPALKVAETKWESMS